MKLPEILVAKDGGKRRRDGGVVRGGWGEPGKGPSHFVLLFGNEL